MSASMRVVVIDDHLLWRAALIDTFDATTDIDVIGEGSTAEEAIQLAGNLRPDLIVLDISMPGGGLYASREIKSASPNTKLVLLTASEDEDDLDMAFEIGVHAYILKGVPARELVSIVRRVGAGETYVPPSVAAPRSLRRERGERP